MFQSISEHHDEGAPEIVARGWPDRERAQPVVDLRGRDRSDHLAVEGLSETWEPRAQILDVTLALAVRFLLGDDLLNQCRRRA